MEWKEYGLTLSLRAPQDDEEVEEEDDDEDEGERHYGHTGGSDSDDDGRGEDDAMLESEIDTMYSAYAARRGLKADKQLKRARARLGKGGELAEAEADWAEEADDDWDGAHAWGAVCDWLIWCKLGLIVAAHDVLSRRFCLPTQIL